MCQNNCNDYSKLTAKTGIASISTANSSLAGVGATTVLTAAGLNGTIVRSVIVKAIQPVTEGMVRLFVKNGSGKISLYQEIPIPVTPTLAVTPTPAPVLQTYEAILPGCLKLPTGYELLASTQNAESFNVVTEALDWEYPSPIPGTCCNFIQETAELGVESVATANTFLNGNGTIAAVFTAGGTNGSRITKITVKATQSVNEGMIRLFVSPTGVAYTLIKEINVVPTAQSAFEESFSMTLFDEYNLESGYVLGASTQLGQSFAISVEAVGWSYPI